MPVTKQSYRYPKDEFDTVPEDAPTGVHRAPRSPWRKAVPFAVVAVVFALLAYGGVTLASNMLDSNDASASTGSSSKASTSTSAGKATTKSTPKSTATSTKKSSSGTSSGSDDSADVDRTLAVKVYNASSINGLAGRGADKVSADGFGTVTAATNKGSKPASSTVYYGSSADKATAQHVASLLGVSDVTQQSGLSAPIVVILVTDLS